MEGVGRVDGMRYCKSGKFGSSSAARGPHGEGSDIYCKNILLTLDAGTPFIRS